MIARRRLKTSALLALAATTSPGCCILEETARAAEKTSTEGEAQEGETAAPAAESDEDRSGLTGRVRAFIKDLIRKRLEQWGVHADWKSIGLRVRPLSLSTYRLRLSAQGLTLRLTEPDVRFTVDTLDLPFVIELGLSLDAMRVTEAGPVEIRVRDVSATLQPEPDPQVPEPSPLLPDFPDSIPLPEPLAQTVFRGLTFAAENLSLTVLPRSPDSAKPAPEAAQTVSIETLLLHLSAQRSNETKDPQQGTPSPPPDQDWAGQLSIKAPRLLSATAVPATELTFGAVWKHGTGQTGSSEPAKLYLSKAWMRGSLEISQDLPASNVAAQHRPPEGPGASGKKPKESPAKDSASGERQGFTTFSTFSTHGPLAIDLSYQPRAGIAADLKGKFMWPGLADPLHAAVTAKFRNPASGLTVSLQARAPRVKNAAGINLPLPLPAVATKCEAILKDLREKWQSTIDCSAESEGVLWADLQPFFVTPQPEAEPDDGARKVLQALEIGSEVTDPVRVHLRAEATVHSVLKTDRWVQTEASVQVFPMELFSAGVTNRKRVNISAQASGQAKIDWPAPHPALQNLEPEPGFHLGNWTAKGSFTARLADVADIIKPLKSTPYAIPASANKLTGPLRFEAEGTMNQDWNGSLTSMFQSDLEGAGQALALHASTQTRLWIPAAETGKAAGDETTNGEPAASDSSLPIAQRLHSDTTAAVTFQKLHIILPQISVEQPPQLVYDTRFDPLKTNSGESADEKIIQSVKDTPEQSDAITPTQHAFRLAARTPSGSPVLVWSNLTDGPIPLYIDLSATSGSPTALDLAADSFTAELFRRRATVKELSFKTRNDAEKADIHGLIEVEYAAYLVTIKVGGTLSHTTMELRSEPPLPEESIYAVLLFGRPLEFTGDGSAATAAAVQRAAASGALTLASLYYLASTPIESITYDPASGALLANMRVGASTAVSLGATQTGRPVLGLSQRLIGNWFLSTSLENDPGSGRTRSSAFLDYFLGLD